MRLSVPSRLLAFPVRAKVLTAIAVACAVALVVGVVGLVQLGALQQRSQEINTDALVPSNQIAEVRRAFLQTRIDALADELLPDAAARAKAHDLYLADLEAMDVAVEAYAGSGLTTAQQETVDALADAWGRYETLVSSDAYRLAVSQGRSADYLAMRSTTIAPVAAELNAALDELLATEAAAAEASVQAATDTHESARTLVLAVLVLGLAGASRWGSSSPG